MGGPGHGVRRGLDALTDFRRDVDDILDQLVSSAASCSKVAALDIPRSSLSGTATPFAEADGLYRQYERVHRQLTGLTGTLGAQIEAMGIAVHGADVGFDQLEMDLRERFWRIRADVRDQAGVRDRATGHGGPVEHGSAARPPRGDGDPARGGTSG